MLMVPTLVSYEPSGHDGPKAERSSMLSIGYFWLPPALPVTQI
jgi:hypothetical protein